MDLDLIGIENDAHALITLTLITMYDCVALPAVHACDSRCASLPRTAHDGRMSLAGNSVTGASQRLA